MWGEPVGTALWCHDNGYASFKYEDSFLQKGLDISPIHMSIESAFEKNFFKFPHLDKYTFCGLPGLLANSLPDNFAHTLIDTWIEYENRAALNPLQILSFINSKGMGALEFELLNSSQHSQQSSGISIQELQRKVKKTLCQETNLGVDSGSSGQATKEALCEMLRVCTSAGGAVPKAIVAINENGHVLSGNVDAPVGYTHYLIKFDEMEDYVAGLQGYLSGNTRIEYAYSLMAISAGIKMMNCSLLEVDNKAHFLTERYDRINNEKMHVVNFGCLSHIGWNEKRLIGYEDLFKTMNALQLGDLQKEEQFRRMVFNIFSRNVDDHVKNHSFTMNRHGEWSLSPAYDLTYTYEAQGLSEAQHKLAVDGMRDNISYRNILHVADRAEINNPENIMEDVANAVAMWPSFASKAGVANKLTAEVGKEHLHDQILSS